MGLARRVLLARVLMVALLLAGCGGSGATTEPTPSPEPEPTVSASARTETSPEFTDAVGGDGWEDFLRQQLVIGEEYPELYDAMLVATEGPIGSITTRLGLASLEMMTWAHEHRTTLLDNPPDDPCYEDAWRVAVEFTDHAYDFGDFSGDLALDPSDAMASGLALSSMEDATTALAELGAAIDEADCSKG